MADLTEEMKEFVVLAVARFDPPSTVAKAVEETYGVKVSRQQVNFYDATSAAARTRKLGNKWVQLFHVARKAFLEQVGEIGVAHKAVRLRRLEQQWAEAYRRGDLAEARETLKQAAQEVGEVYTNRSKVDMGVHVQVTEARREELIKKFTARIEKAFENRAKAAGILIEGEATDVS